MIPRYLFLTFLSFRIPEESPSTSDNVNLFEDTTLQHDIDLGAQIPLMGQTHDSAELRPKPQGEVCHGEVGARRIDVVDFDSLPSGDWDDRKVINGSVQLLTDGFSRIWSLPDAFPNLESPHGVRHAFGAYPAGQVLTIKFIDGPHDQISTDFGYIVNGQLSNGFYSASYWKGGRKLGELKGYFNDYWALAYSASLAPDEVRLVVAGANPTGLLLLEHLEYNEIEPEQNRQ